VTDRKHGPLPDKKYFLRLAGDQVVPAQIRGGLLVARSYVPCRNQAFRSRPAEDRRQPGAYAARASGEACNGWRSSSSRQKTVNGRWYGLDPKDKVEWFVTIKNVNTGRLRVGTRSSQLQDACGPTEEKLPSRRDRRPDPAGQVRPDGEDGTTTGTAEAQVVELASPPREKRSAVEASLLEHGQDVDDPDPPGHGDPAMPQPRGGLPVPSKELRKKGLVDDDSR